MELSRDEARALGLVAALLAAAAVGRVAAAPRGEVRGEAGPAVEVAALAAASREALDARRPLAAGERIDPNTATERELGRLPGVGPATARRIVAERERGAFTSAADLVRVPGIGPRTAEKLAPHLALPERAPPAGGGAIGGAAGGARAPPARVDPNRASAAELEALPGVGPALAARIVAERQAGGAYRAASDLTRVRGIGPATAARLAPHLTLPP
jgi:competence ComEA-like helix-hairpin-helix protein